MSLLSTLSSFLSGTENLSLIFADEPSLFPEDQSKKGIAFGPYRRVLKRDGIIGNSWIIALTNGRLIRVSIQDGVEKQSVPPSVSEPYTSEDFISLISRIPEFYWKGLEIISDNDEDGLTVYKEGFEGAVGVGSREFINVTHLGILLVIHEIGHAIEQRYTEGLGNSSFPEQWTAVIEADAPVITSSYGEKNWWEDCAEFCRLYAIASKITGGLVELNQKSPSRYALWETVIDAVNASEIEKNGENFKFVESEIAKSSFETDLDPGEEEKNNENMTTIVVSVCLISILVLTVVYYLSMSRSKSNVSTASRMMMS